MIRPGSLAAATRGETYVWAEGRDDGRTGEVVAVLHPDEPVLVITVSSTIGFPNEDVVDAFVFVGHGTGWVFNAGRRLKKIR